jgi:membrane protein required for colicin V production
MIGMLNFLDIILIIIFFLSIIFGILKGFIRELFSLAFFIIGVVLSFLFYYDVGELFMPHLKNREVSNFAGFITIFVVVLIVGSLGTYLIKKLFSLGPLKSIDMILGGVFGLLRGILIASIIVFALIVFPVNDGLVTKSRLSPYVLASIEVFVHFLPAKYQEKIQSIKTG